jgi:hypothetical protein
MTIWMVSSRTSCLLFATKDLAYAYLALFPSSVNGGLDVAEVQVNGSPSYVHRDAVIEECARAVIGARVLWDDELPTVGERVHDALEQVAEQVRKLSDHSSCEQERTR